MYIAQLLSTLISLESEIDNVSVEYERRELELWKKDQERVLMIEMERKR